MKKPKISVLLPTRKRFESLKRSVESLRSTCTHSELEILLALDEDDVQTIRALESDPISSAKTLIGPRKGYIKLHEYINELCKLATGEWLFLWNDDSIMETQGWDAIVESYSGQFVVLNPETNHPNHPRENCIFPIVPKKWFDELGHFSLSNHNDTYVERIANTLGIRRDVPIRVLHDRADLTGANDDEVYAEREFTTGEFYGGENSARIQEDIQTLSSFLAKANQKKIGFVGLGKLGLPCALAIEEFGKHEVWGTDVSEIVLDNVRQRHIPYREAGAQELLDKSSIRVGTVEELVEHCEIVFIAVQTPHEERFEGITPLPEDRADFDYRYLREAVASVACAAKEKAKRITVAVISTVLPGTMEREIRPLLNEFTQLAYNPFFIAMGTTIEDFMNPEFVLLGSDSPVASKAMKEFYASLHDAEVLEMSIESAELTKVAYNTFIGMKIVFANTLMEISEGTGANVDAVTGALGRATKRLISTKYLQAGMGDGGGCHPRDNIAMSYLARKLELSYDLFEALMIAREKQTEWLAHKAIETARKEGLPIVILGKAFKPESNLIVGSPAILLRRFLETSGTRVTMYDPHIDDHDDRPDFPAVYIVATKHPEFQAWPYPDGSTVIDPWGYVDVGTSYKVRQVGRGPTSQ